MIVTAAVDKISAYDKRKAGKDEVNSMRAEDDLTYQEYKDGVHDCMIQYEKFGWTPRQVTDWMTEEDNDMLIGTSEAL